MANPCHTGDLKAILLSILPFPTVSTWTTSSRCRYGSSLCLIAFPVYSIVSFPEVALTVDINCLLRLLVAACHSADHSAAPRAVARLFHVAFHRPDDDARPRGLAARAGARGAATVAFVFLLRALDLPVPELPLVEVKRCQGNDDDPHEHGHQHEEREGGGERREEAQVLRAGVVDVGSVTTVRRGHRHRRSRGLRGGSGFHSVHLS